MDDNTPAPEALDDLLVSQVDSPEGGLTVEQRRDAVRAENAVAAAYWGGFQPRIVVTFLVFAAAWVWVVVAGVTVNEGDCVVLDGDGCVVIARSDSEQVLTDSDRYAAAEEAVVVAIAGGEALSSAYRHKADVVADLRG